MILMLSPRGVCATFPAHGSLRHRPLDPLPARDDARSACAHQFARTDGPVGPNGYRLPSNVWCAVALFDDREAAEATLATHERHGALFVMTTAGVRVGPALDMARVIDFRVHVDKVHAWLQTVDGRVASQVFAPHTVGDDGVTMSLWRSDAAMVNAMYRPGTHRTQIERQKRDVLADRTSFTRLRVLQTRGRWGGVDPVEPARGGS